MSGSGAAEGAVVAVRPPRRAATVGWAVLSALVAGLLVALSALGPVIPLAAVVGLGAVLLAAFKPKAFALAGVFVIILSVPIENVVGPVGSYADEATVALAAVAFSVRRFVTSGRLVWLPGSLWFAGFVALGAISSVVHGVGLGIAGPGGFIAVKSVVFAFALAQLRWEQRDLRIAIRFGVGTIVVLALTGLVNLVAPVPWARLTTGNAPFAYVHGIPALNGPFQHPAAFSRLNTVLAIAVFGYAMVIRRSARNTVLLVVASGLAILTFEVKSLVALILGVGLLGARFLRPVGLAAVIGLGPLVLGVLVPVLHSFVGGDITLYVFGDSARAALAYGSIVVANRYFPLGAGFGRYGSATAASHYSPEYYRLGFDRITGLGPLDGGQYLNDNQWPAVIGEAGYFGAACLAVGIILAGVSLARRVSPGEEPLSRWLRVTGIGWIVVLMVESLVAPVFVSAPSYPFVFAAVGVVASLRDSARWPVASPAAHPAAPGPGWTVDVVHAEPVLSPPVS